MKFVLVLAAIINGQLSYSETQGFETMALCREALAEFKADYQAQGIVAKGDCYVMPEVTQ